MPRRAGAGGSGHRRGPGLLVPAPPQAASRRDRCGRSRDSHLTRYWQLELSPSNTPRWIQRYSGKPGHTGGLDVFCCAGEPDAATARPIPWTAAERCVQPRHRVLTTPLAPFASGPAHLQNGLILRIVSGGSSARFSGGSPPARHQMLTLLSGLPWAAMALARTRGVSTAGSWPPSS